MSVPLFPVGLDQLAETGEIEEASVPGADRRLWRLTARTADPAYRAGLRKALYPGREFRSG